MDSLTKRCNFEFLMGFKYAHLKSQNKENSFFFFHSLKKNSIYLFQDVTVNSLSEI